MTQELELTNISFTNGSNIAVVNNTQDISAFKAGDIIFTVGNNPVFVQSISGSNITLTANASFSAANTTAVLMASNVKLRDALATIQTNNSAWAQHFAPFMNWIATSDLTATMYDINGAPVSVYSAKGLNQLASDIGEAVTLVSQLNTDVTTLSSTVSSIQGDLNQKLTDATTEANKSKDWATKATEVEPSLQSAKTYALQAAQSFSDANQAKLDAQTAKNLAETILDNFDDRYLGAFASDPALDNDGNTLQVGAICLNTTENSLRFWSGTEWLTPQESIVTSAQAASSNAVLAQQYANHPEDQIIPNTTEYSAYHWKKKAQGIAGDYLPLAGGNVTGALDVAGNLTESGQRVYSPNNKPSTAEIAVNAGYEELAIVEYQVPSATIHNNTTLKSGFFTTEDGLPNADNTGDERANWHHVINMHHHHANGYSSQIGVSYYSADYIGFRCSNNGTWSPWIELYHENHKPTPAEIGADDTKYIYKNTSGNFTADMSLAKHTVVQLWGNHARTITLTGTPITGGTLKIIQSYPTEFKTTITGKTMYLIDGTSNTTQDLDGQGTAVFHCINGVDLMEEY